MTRILFRIFFSYILFGILRTVERKFGLLGVLILALFVFLPLLCLRFLPFVLRAL